MSNWEKYYNTPAFARARIRLIEYLVHKNSFNYSIDQKFSHKAEVLLKGRIPDELTNGKTQLEYIKDAVERIDILKNPLDFQPDNALSFEELTSLGTWFFMHPEKALGTEIETTSMQFPLQLKFKGDVKQAITDIINKTLNNSSDSEPTQSKDKRIRIAKAKAQALKLKLQLI